MYIKQLNIVEPTCMLFVNHPDTCVPKIVNDFKCIPVCLYVVHHESFEIWFGKCVLDHCFIELCPHDLLHFSVFKLYVTNYNGHDFVIHPIICMASHYNQQSISPLYNPLMIGNKTWIMRKLNR